MLPDIRPLKPCKRSIHITSFSGFRQNSLFWVLNLFDVRLDYVSIHPSIIVNAGKQWGRAIPGEVQRNSEKGYALLFLGPAEKSLHDCALPHHVIKCCSVKF